MGTPISLDMGVPCVDIYENCDVKTLMFYFITNSNREFSVVQKLFMFLFSIDFTDLSAPSDIFG